MLILCCGNADRGDDAAGPLVARRLGEMGVEAREYCGDALSLLDVWQGAEDVILVDALVSGKPPGTVSIWDALEARMNGHAQVRSSHALGLAAAIELARTLGCLPRRLTFFGIEARRFGFGRPPSNSVVRGAARAARKIYEYCVDQRMPAV